MAEYVSKETLQAKLNRKKAEPANKRYTEGWNDAILMVKSMIHSEKAADVEPVVHGRWDDEHKCTVCHNEAFYKISNIRPDYDYDWEENLVETGDYIWDIEWVETAYCPNCGCKMDLEG